MTSTLATALAHPTVVYGGWWPGPWFLLIPLFWIAVVVAIVAFAASRRRRWAAAGYGPGGPCGPWGGPGAHGTATSVLAERFARGEIDEAEYRARLETLLATERRPQA
jgi:putative membrane protein